MSENLKQFQPHQQRVVDEKNELDEKIGKLQAFFDNEIYKNLPNEDRALLIEQVNHMRIYSDILFRRIQRF